jgi:hypothetical protein
MTLSGERGRAGRIGELLNPDIGELGCGNRCVAGTGVAGADG